VKSCMETMKVHKITICGGGNGAQTLVPIAACNLGCPVDVYASFADEAERLRAGIAAHGGLEVTGAVQGKARPRRVSADPAEVIPGSDVVVLVLPAFAHESTLRQIVPFLDESTWVGAMPARGGFDYCAAQVLADAGSDVAVVELGYRNLAIVEAQDGIVVNTNHFVSPSLKESFVDYTLPPVRGNSFHRYDLVVKGMKLVAEAEIAPRTALRIIKNNLRRSKSWISPSQ